MKTEQTTIFLKFYIPSFSLTQLALSISFILLWTSTHGHNNLHYTTAVVISKSEKSRSLSQNFHLLGREEQFYRTGIVWPLSLLTFPVVTFFTCVEGCQSWQNSESRILKWPLLEMLPYLSGAFLDISLKMTGISQVTYLCNCTKINSQKTIQFQCHWYLCGQK